MEKLQSLKTFADACKIEKLDAKKIIPDFKGFVAKHRKAMQAHAMLVIIAQAANRLANDGKPWKPNWKDSDQVKYHPYFYMGGEGGSSGFQFLDYGRWDSRSNVGSRLCFKTYDTAEYVGKQFKALYKQYYFM